MTRLIVSIYHSVNCHTVVVIAMNCCRRIRQAVIGTSMKLPIIDVLFMFVLMWFSSVHVGHNVLLSTSMLYMS